MELSKWEAVAERAWEAVFNGVKKMHAEGQTYQEIADRLGIKSKGVVADWLNGKRQSPNAPFPQMLQYLEAVGTSPLRFIEGYSEETNGKPDDLATVNVYQVAAAGAPIDLRTFEPLFTVKAQPECLRGSAYALLVEGHSMEPLIPDGSIVGVQSDFRFQANELYAAWIPYEGLVVKRVGVDHATNEFVFKSQNPDKESYPDFRIPISSAEKVVVGKIVWIMIRW